MLNAHVIAKAHHGYIRKIKIEDGTVQEMYYSTSGSYDGRGAFRHLHRLHRVTLSAAIRHITGSKVIIQDDSRLVAVGRAS